MTVAVLLLVWAAGLHRLRLLARAPNLARKSYALGSVGIAAAYTTKLYGQHLDGWISPNLSDLVEHLFVVAALLGVQIFLLSLRTGQVRKKQARGSLALAATVTIAMTALFVIAPVHQTEAADFDSQYGSVAAVTVYKLIFGGYLAYILAASIALCARYMKVPGDHGRTLSLRFVAVGCAVGLIYAGARVIYTLAFTTSGTRLGAVQTVGDAAIGISLITIAIGIIAPEVVPIIDRYLRARRQIRVLQPLWHSLRQKNPHAVLMQRSTWTLRGAEFASHRMIVEIEDMLQLIRMSDEKAAQIMTAQEPLRALAEALHEPTYYQGAEAGIPAAALLPTAESRSDDRAIVRAFAEQYTRCAEADDGRDLRWQSST